MIEPYDCWPGLGATATERFWDGFDLATSYGGRRTGAIYLLGYAAEMVLKAAYFRACGVPPNSNIQPHLSAARTHAAWTGRNYHDLSAWVNLLITERASRGVPLDPAFAGKVAYHVLHVESHWREYIRYRHTPAMDSEVAEVFISVDWLLSNESLL